MAEIDKRNRLDDEIFSYRPLKDGRVLIFWVGRQVKTLADAEAQTFLAKIDGLESKEAQLVMAKLTGNFKRGNER